MKGTMPRQWEQAVFISQQDGWLKHKLSTKWKLLKGEQETFRMFLPWCGETFTIVVKAFLQCKLCTPPLEAKRFCFMFSDLKETLLGYLWIQNSLPTPLGFTSLLMTGISTKTFWLGAQSIWEFKNIILFVENAILSVNLEVFLTHIL
jgi:hypothetical protein